MTITTFIVSKKLLIRIFRIIQLLIVLIFTAPKLLQNCSKIFPKIKSTIFTGPWQILLGPCRGMQVQLENYNMQLYFYFLLCYLKELGGCLENLLLNLPFSLCPSFPGKMLFIPWLNNSDRPPETAGPAPCNWKTYPSWELLVREAVSLPFPFLPED